MVRERSRGNEMKSEDVFRDCVFCMALETGITLVALLYYRDVGHSGMVWLVRSTGTGF